MKRERMMGLAKRILHMIDSDTTDLAAGTYQQPIVAYTSAEIFARERELLFGRTPMFIGMSNEIPTPGTFFTRDIVDTPFLALRHRDGQVRLYLNACSHRGAKVSLSPCGSGRLFTCPYHAWSYDHDGRLVGVPEPHGFDDIDRNTYGLVSLPVAEKYGMIFGCATPGIAIDIDELLGGLGPELAEWGFEKFTVHGEPHVHETDGNWKYAWDTFCENYHFGTLHRNTLGSYLISTRQAFDIYGRNVRMCSGLRSIEEMRKLPEDEWNPAAHISVQYRLFPAVNFSVYPDFMAVFWLMPGNHAGHAKALHITYLSKPTESQEKLDHLNFLVARGCKEVVQAEDFWMTAVAQTGMKAPGARRNFTMGRNEPALQHFARLFAETAQYESIMSEHRSPETKGLAAVRAQAVAAGTR